MSLSKSMNKTWIELFSKEVHYAAVTILLVISIYVQHQGKLLHSWTQINWFLLTSTELKSNEVAFTVGPFVIESVSSFFPRERPRVYAQLKNLLSKVVE